MRHEDIKNLEAYDVVEIAGWNDHGADQQAPREAPRGAAAVPDMPAAAGAMMVAVYAGLMGAFALTLGRDGPAAFAIAIGVFFVIMFFAIPAVFLRMEGGDRRPSLAAFLETGIDTATGRISGAGALVQMLIVPLLLAFAILAIGVINLVI